MKTTFISIALLCCLAALHAQIPTDAIARYTMDGMATDASQNGNDGTLIGGVTTAPDRFGYACGALKFDGVTGYITVPSSPSLKQPTSAFTVAVWVKMEQNPSSPTRKWLTVCCKSDQQVETPTSPQWRVQSMQDDARGYNTVSINTDFTEPAQENLLLSTWFMYVVRYDGQSVNAYIDGKQAFTFAYNKPFTPNDLPLEIGRDVPGGMEFFCGTMDDLLIFDRALSTGEINALFRDQSGKNRNDQITITCPTDIVKTAPAGQCSLPVNYDDATAAVDCGTAPVKRIAGPGSEDEFPVGETTVTYEAKSSNGQSSTCSFVVKVLENGNATLQCPPSRTLRNDLGTCGAVVTYADPSASGACSSPQMNRIAGLASGATFPLGETTVTYRAGKSIKLPGGGSSPKGSECSFKITVKDQEPPTITCPADVRVQATTGSNTATIDLSDPQYADNCPGVNWAQTRPAPQASAPTFQLGSSTVTYQATDAAGNTATCTFKVIVEQTNELGLHCPSDRVVPADLGDCAAKVTFPNATLTGNMPNAKIAQIEGGKSGSVFAVGSETITYQATAPSGERAECSFQITVEDREKPTIQCPADIHVSTDPERNTAKVNFPDPQYADNCPGVKMSRTQGSNLGANANFPIGTTTLGFQARDAAGNTATCTFKVIVDQVKVNELGLHCPSDRVVPADQGDCATKVTFPDATLTGNTPNAKVTQIDGQLSGASFAVGSETITFQASAPTGERATCSFKITVQDREKPTIKCPVDVRIAAREGSNAAVVNFPDPQAADNCPGVKWDQTQGDGSGASFPIGKTTLSYEARDAAGNTAICDFTVEVTSQATKLGLRCPSDKVVPADAGACEAIVNFPAATLTGDAPGATINQVSGPWSGAAFPVGMQTIKYAATDDLGRQAECSFRITVRDEEPPTITCPGDVNIQIEAGKNSAVGNYPEPQYADNCPGVLATGMQGAKAIGIGTTGSFALGNTELTYKAQDASGNTSTCSFVVTVTPADPQLPSRIDGDTIVYSKSEIPVGSRNIRVYYYDHQDQDGDTVSLNYDGRWLVDHEKIMGRKNKLENNRFIDLDVSPGKVHYLVSKAWNEGKKPTNTLTIEIVDGVNPARIFNLTSNVGKSSAIKIYYKK